MIVGLGQFLRTMYGFSQHFITRQGLPHLFPLTNDSAKCHLYSVKRLCKPSQNVILVSRLVVSERCTCTKVEGCRVAQKRPPSWLTARNSCFSLQLSSRFADIRPDLRSSKRQSSRHLVALSSSLKESAGAYDCHTLVHDPLADPEVAVNPPFDFFALGELVALQTGGESGRSLDAC